MNAIELRSPAALADRSNHRSVHWFAFSLSGQPQQKSVVDGLIRWHLGHVTIA
jgi:hypothetical protein